MKIRCVVAILLACAPMGAASKSANGKRDQTFQTSDRCLACHVGLITPSGQDVSIGTEWRSSIMANSSRDPYWQASVRRGYIDHPRGWEAVGEEGSMFHLPISRLVGQPPGRARQNFTLTPL